MFILNPANFGVIVYSYERVPAASLSTCFMSIAFLFLRLCITPTPPFLLHPSLSLSHAHTYAHTYAHRRHSFLVLGTVLAQWLRAGQQINRSSDRFCTWGIIHTKSHLISPGCPRPSTALQSRIVAPITTHLLSLFFSLVSPHSQ